MKLKDGVTFDGTALSLSGRNTAVAEKDIWLIEELISGRSDEKQFVELAAQRESQGEIDASFRMALFVEEYGEYIDSDDNAADIFE